MAYIITKTNGDVLVSVPDTQLVDNYGITLVGRNYSGYGVFLNDNFISIMENFANSTAPASPLKGQLWYDTTQNKLKLWEGNVFKPIGTTVTNATPPSSTGVNIGDLWYDTTNFQLKVWTGGTAFVANATASSIGDTVSITSSSNLAVGDILTHTNISTVDNVSITQILSSSSIKISANAVITSGDNITFTRGSGWLNVGPIYNKTQGRSGIIPTTIIDTQSIPHTVGLVYNNNTLVATISSDKEFVPITANALTGFSSIKPGIQLKNGTATQHLFTVMGDSEISGGSTLIKLSTTSDLNAGDYLISTNVSIGAGVTITDIFPSNSSVLVNTITYANTGEEVIFQNGLDTYYVFSGTIENAQRLNNIPSDLFTRRDRAESFLSDVTVRGNLKVGASTDDNGLVVNKVGSDIEISNLESNGNITLYANISGIGNKISVLNVNGTNGNIEVYGDPSTAKGIATKQYVDSANTSVTNNLTNSINALIGNNTPNDRKDFGNISLLANSIVSSVDALTNVVALKAYTQSPTFTGVPMSVTPASGNVSTMIATTAFVDDIVSSTSANLSANIATALSGLELKANILSPTFTGVPTAPTATIGTNNTQIATTAFVGAAIGAIGSSTISGLNLKADINSPTFTGIPSAANASPGTNTTQIATTAFVFEANAGLKEFLLANTASIANDLTNYAPLLSPLFVGSPKAPTASQSTANTQISTTAYVRTAIANLNGLIDGNITALLALKAPLASPTLTGTPLSTTPSFGDNSTKIATTAFVANAISYSFTNSPTLAGTVTAPTVSSSDNSTKVATTAFVTTAIASASVPKWSGSNKFISNVAPTSGDGANGDLWFQYTP